MPPSIEITGFVTRWWCVIWCVEVMGNLVGEEGWSCGTMVVIESEGVVEEEEKIK